MRIVRLVKMLRIFKQIKLFKRLIEFANLNAGVVRMIKVAGTVCFLVHLMACFWYLLAKVEGFTPDTWVI